MGQRINTTYGIPSVRGGQGLLSYRLRPALELAERRRALTAVFLLDAVFVGTQGLSPFGPATEPRWAVAVFAALVLAGVVCLLASHRLMRARGVLIVEQILVGLSVLLTTALVHVSGGTDSPFLLAYLPALLFAAYFFDDGRLLLGWVVAIATLAFTPLLRDAANGAGVGFLPLNVISLICFVTGGYMIAYKRRAKRGAEWHVLRLELIDPLTGVANASAFDEISSRLATAGQDRDFGLVLVGVEGLRAAQTAYGYAAGDDLIARVAELLRDSCTVDDQVARRGEDEFAVLLPGAASGDVILFRDRFTTLVKRYNEQAHGTNPPIVVSTGGAVFGAECATFAELEALAEDRMFVLHDEDVIETSRLAIRRDGGRGRRITIFEAQKRIAWLESANVLAPSGYVIVAVMFLVSTLLPGANPSYRGGTLAMAGFDALIGAWALAGAWHYRRLARRVAEYLMLVVSVPGLILTGRLGSSIAATMILVFAYFAYFYDERKGRRIVAALSVMMIGVIALDSGGSAVEWIHFAITLGGCVVLALALQFNGRALKAAEYRARELAMEDALTGVGSHRAFEDAIERRIAAAAVADTEGPAAHSGRPILVVVTFSEMTEIVTVLGRKGGERVLRAVASRLRDAVTDRGVVYRVGDQDFAVLGDGSRQDATALARGCREHVDQFRAENAEELRGVNARASTGVARWVPGIDAAGLMACAESDLRRNRADDGDNVSMSVFSALRLAFAQFTL